MLQVEHDKPQANWVVAVSITRGRLQPYASGLFYDEARTLRKCAQVRGYHSAEVMSEKDFREKVEAYYRVPRYSPPMDRRAS